MTIEEQLKQEILSKYKSVRAFTTAVDIPYSTLDSVFKRGISNAGVSTMIKVFNALDLDIESIKGDRLQHRTDSKKSPDMDESASGERVGQIFDKLNDMLVSVGFIKDGEDITNRQAEVLLAVCRILAATFKN